MEKQEKIKKLDELHNKKKLKEMEGREFIKLFQKLHTFTSGRGGYLPWLCSNIINNGIVKPWYPTKNEYLLQ